MGSGHSSSRRGAIGAVSAGPNLVAGRFEHYLREITPAFLREARDRQAAASRPRDGQPDAGNREAMAFFSESRMR